MKVTTFSKLALGAGIIAVAASSLVATPAFADPAFPTSTALVGLGSDTTQDVMDEIAKAIGGNKLASYTSTIPSGGTHFVQTRPDGSSQVIRAKGSGDGWNLLQVAEGSQSSKSVAVVDTASTFTANKANTVGQIDFARASSKRGTASTTGEYVNIPFARDVVGVVANPGSAVSKIPLTLGAAGDTKSTPSLYAIYHCTTKVVYINDADGTYNSVGDGTESTPAGTTKYSITPLVPGYGSGTASFFLSALGISDASGLTGTYSCLVRTMLDGTTNIQEHDGAPVAERTNSLGIYSIGQFLTQTNSGTTGVTDKTSGTTLLQVNGKNPTTGGTGPSALPNTTDWPASLMRLVYNVVPYRKAVDSTSKIHEMFVGTDSLVCQQTASMTKMGFAPLPGSDGGDPTADPTLCGSIANSLRAYSVSGGNPMSVAATVTNASDVAAAAAQVGSPITVNVNGGTALHDMGGTVQVLDAAYGTPGAHVLGSATIGEGTGVTASVAVTPIATGVTPLYAVFIPKLGGINVTPMSPISVSDASFASVTVKTGSTTKISVRKPSTGIGGTVRVVAWVDSSAAPGGTVTLYQDSTSGTVLGTDTLDAGDQAGVINYTQTSASVTLVAKYVSADGSVITSTSSPVTVALAKATPTAATGTLPSAPNGFVAGVAPVYANAALRVRAGTTTTTTFTVNATSDLITASTNHGLNVNDKVRFTAATMPGGLTANTDYYVIATGKTLTAFKVAATLGGAAVNITTAGTTVVAWKNNVAPKVAITLTGPTGTSLKPSGSVRVYIGASATDRSTEVSVNSTGLTLVPATSGNTSTATITLPAAATWAAAASGVTSTGKIVYLIVDYVGDDTFNTQTLNKQIKLTP